MRAVFAISLALLTGLAPGLSTSADEGTSRAQEDYINTTFVLIGYGGLNNIQSDAFDFGEADQFGLLGGSARGVFENAKGLGFQFDIGGEKTSNDRSAPEDNYLHSIYATGHLYTREAEFGQFGVFGGLAYADVGDNPDHDRATVGYAGFEGQAFLDDFTFFAQAGYLHTLGYENSSLDNDFPRDSVFARAGMRYFLDKNTKLEGELSALAGTFDRDDSYNIIGWALEAEHVFAQPDDEFQLAAFARYEGFRASQEFEDEYSTDTTIKVGLKGYFGGGQSLYKNDREGASLSSPDAGRWAGILAGPVE